VPGLSHSQWQPASHRSSFRPEGGQSDLGRWVLAAVATSITLHLVLWKFAGQLGLPDYFGASTAASQDDRIPLDLRRARINEEAAAEAVDPPPEQTPVEREPPPPTAEPVDLTQFKDLKFEELRMSPETEVPRNIVTSPNPAAGSTATNAASLLAAVPSPSASNTLSKEIETASRRVLLDPKISDHQVVVPVADDPLPGDDLLSDSIAAAAKRGQGGTGDTDGFASLDDLLSYQGPMTADKIAMLPTDLLFEYNSAELKDGARLSLMKLGFIIQKNPQADISIEGHTDTFGGEVYNQRLSEARAAAVKHWLVESLRLEASRLRTRGWGEARLLVHAGDQQQQAKNRRVEIVIKANR
jgi:outer membrane protein OmpA-like peptidoglycan-associated protein